MSYLSIGMLPCYNYYQAAVLPQASGQTAALAQMLGGSVSQAYMPYAAWPGAGSSFAGLLQQCLSAQKAKSEMPQAEKSSKACTVCGCSGEKQTVENLVDIIQQACLSASRGRWNAGVSASDRVSQYADSGAASRSRRSMNGNAGLSRIDNRHHIW